MKIKIRPCWLKNSARVERMSRVVSVCVWYLCYVFFVLFFTSFLHVSVLSGDLINLPTSINLFQLLWLSRPFSLPFLTIILSASLPQLAPFLTYSFELSHLTFWPHPFPFHFPPSLNLSISSNTSLSSFLPSHWHPPPHISETVRYKMKCTFWETLVPIFISLYLPRLECHCY